MIKAINSYDLGENRKRDFRLFLLAFFLFLLYGVLWQLHIGWYYADSYVTTLLAFSYLSHGFFRRGLVGTIFDLICRVIPSAQSFKGAIWFMWGMNIIYFYSLLAFTKWILGKIERKEVYRGAYFFALFCFAFMIPTVCTRYGALGRADLLQIVLCVLQIYLLVEMKREWLTVPMTAINVMFHEGYVLMTFCTVLIVIIFRAVNTEGKRGKYWVLFALHIVVLLVMSVLSLVCTRSGSAEGYEEAKQLAISFNASGSVHWNLLYMMSGFTPEDAVFIDDAWYVAEARKELPIFLVCFIPVFYILGKGLVNLFKQSGGKKRGTHITAVLLGPMLIGVEYVKYCDYGRYILWLAFYFFVMFLSFAAMNDEGAEGSLSKSYAYTNMKAILIVALFMIYQPLPTCNFTLISRKLKQLIYPVL